MEKLHEETGTTCTEILPQEILEKGQGKRPTRKGQTNDRKRSHSPRCRHERRRIRDYILLQGTPKRKRQSIRQTEHRKVFWPTAKPSGKGWPGDEMLEYKASRERWRQMWIYGTPVERLSIQNNRKRLIFNILGRRMRANRSTTPYLSTRTTTNIYTFTKTHTFL